MAGLTDKGIVFGADAVRRITAAVRFVERMPRKHEYFMPRAVLSSSTGLYYSAPSTTIAAASGTAPSVTPGTLASQTVYQVQDISGTPGLVALDGTYTLYNWLSGAWNATLLAEVAPDGLGNYALRQQPCP